MHIIQKKRNATPMVVQLRNSLKSDRGEFAPSAEVEQKLGGLVTGIEQFNEENSGSLDEYVETFTQSFRDNVIDAYDGLGAGNEDFSNPHENIFNDNSYQAASVIMAAQSNPGAYQNKALRVEEMHGEGVINPDLVGTAGSLNYTDTGLEAFDESELRNFLPESIMFNMSAVRQNPFSEMYYKTIVVAPTQPGLDISVQRPLVYPDQRRDYSTEYGNWDHRNLLDGVIDHTILDNNAVKVIPARLTTPEDTTDNFAPAADVAPNEVTVEGTTYETAPLVVGKNIPLLQLATHPGLRKAGDPDFTDALDPRVALENVYLKVDNGDGTSVIRLNTHRLPGVQWLKSPEGRDRDMVLNFSNQDLALTGKTLAADASVPSALTALQASGQEDTIVRLKTTIMGRANLQFGEVEVTSARVSVAGVYRRVGTGNYQELVDPSTAASIESALGTMEILYFDVEGTRSLLNKHTRGLIIDTMMVQEKFPILMGQPLTSLKPVSSPTTNDSAAIESLIAGARIRNDNNAVTKLLNYAETLEAMDPNTNRDTDVPEIEGMARFFVRPYFERREVDLLNAVNSVKSHERALDVRATLVNEIRRWTYSALKHSGYAAACDYMPGGDIEVLIGTDRELANHIQIDGDTRLTGLNVQYQMQTSDDQRIYDKIILGISRRSNASGVDILGFGTHVWVPELVGTTNIDRQGRTSRELTVQLRNRHINMVPIMAILEVSNLKEAVTEYIDYKTVDVTPEEP